MLSFDKVAKWRSAAMPDEDDEDEDKGEDDYEISHVGILISV